MRNENMAKNNGVSQAKRWVKKCAKAVAILLVAYLFVLVAGLIPVNNHFVPVEDGVTIYLVSNSVHADLIVPVENEVVDWRDDFADTEFLADPMQKSHVAFGWGDRGFYLETPTWNDLKFSTAANALFWPSDTCIHVDFTNLNEYSQPPASLTLSREQYEQLIQFIRDSFVTDHENIKQIKGHQFGSTDAFFEAKGTYHALNTCNSWVGRALKSSGVSVPLLTPLPKTPMLYLPEQHEHQND